MKAIQSELDRLREFSAFLEQEVESGKGVISEVTDELISVRAQQNDVDEQLRRREQQITVLQDKLAKKDAYIDQFSRQVASSGPSDRRDELDFQAPGEQLKADNVVAEPAVFQNGHTHPGQLRMLVGRHDNKASKHPVVPGGISVGTGPENDIRVQNPFVSYRHATITAPTLILWGMDDPWQKSDDGRQLAAEIPGALFKPLEGVSHWLQQDAPEQFTAAVLEFLGNS